jgi:LPS O-antigen subunit length determinant protein (WzzB/FepE family)
MTPAELKQALYDHCLAYVDQRIQTAQSAMEAAQQSANEESKSSAGDKYETGRAMAQIERDRHAQQLAEALKLKQELGAIDPSKTSASVGPGSLVITDRGTFFVAISLGKVLIEQTDYFVVSTASPIGAALRNRRAGEEVSFNRLVYRINACL